MVEAEIRRLEDYMEHTERDAERAERRLDELARRMQGDETRDRRTLQRMGDFIVTIGLTRIGARTQREEVDRLTREAAGQGLAVARARAMGQADSGKVKEQVEEKLRGAEQLKREVATMDSMAKDLGERMQGLQERLNRHDQARREHQGQAAEHVERVRQEVAARRQEATRLRARREELRKREEECNRKRDHLNTESPSGEPAKNRVKENNSNENPTRQVGESHNAEDGPHHRDNSGGRTRHPEGAISKDTRDNNDTQAGPSNPDTRKEEQGSSKGHKGQHKKKRGPRRGANSTGTTHHGVTKEDEGQQEGRPKEGQGEHQEDNAIGANHHDDKGAIRKYKEAIAAGSRDGVQRSAENLAKTYSNIAQGHNKKGKHREATKASQREEGRGRDAGARGQEAGRARKEGEGPEEGQDGVMRDHKAKQGAHHAQHAGDHDRKEAEGQERERGRGRGDEETTKKGTKELGRGRGRGRRGGGGRKK